MVKELYNLLVAMVLVPSTAYLLLSRSVASTIAQKVYIDVLRYIFIMISSEIWALMAMLGINVDLVKLCL